MNDIKIYSVSDRYISYLREDERLKGVFDNKEDARLHTRKYLGIVFAHGSFDYFIPFSSPKKSDFIVFDDGTRVIRKSIIPIIRMVTFDTVSGCPELKGTLKLSNMIPVPKSELAPYDIGAETDMHYKQIMTKEWEFIRANVQVILKNAKVLYNQRTKCETLFSGKKKPGYLNDTIDFQYAEIKCALFQMEQGKESAK